MNGINLARLSASREKDEDDLATLLLGPLFMFCYTSVFLYSFLLRFVILLLLLCHACPIVALALLLLFSRANRHPRACSLFHTHPFVLGIGTCLLLKVVNCLFLATLRLLTIRFSRKVSSESGSNAMLSLLHPSAAQRPYFRSASSCGNCVRAVRECEPEMRTLGCMRLLLEPEGLFLFSPERY